MAGCKNAARPQFASEGKKMAAALFKERPPIVAWT
jgi:hypothetical protein